MRPGNYQGRQSGCLSILIQNNTRYKPSVLNVLNEGKILLQRARCNGEHRSIIANAR